jgi:anti-anti-sigma factor
MELSSREEQGCTILAITGRLDTVATPVFDAWWRGFIANGGRTLILNFRSLTYVSSSGLGSVVALAKELKSSGGYLAIANLGGLVKEVFEISMLDKVIPIWDDVPAALAKIPSG